MKTARRLSGTKPSPIRVVSDNAPPDAIPLGLGAPTWAMPEPARAALAAFAGPVPYGPNPGNDGLRRAIADYHGAAPEEVVATVGSQEALFDLFHAFLDPGDAVLYPDPGFPAYPALAQLCAADSVTYPLDRANRWRIDALAFERALAATPRAKIAVINPPSNPTGAAADRATLERIAGACEARDVLLVSDEVYRDLYFGVRPPALRDVTKRGVVVSSVSKGWGSPGLRLGWMVGPPEIVDAARLVHNHAVTSAAWTSQLAAEALIRDSERVLGAARREVGMRWDALARALLRHLGEKADPPDGTFYHWRPVPPRFAKDALGFCLRLRDEAKVVLIPGTAFGNHGADHIRLSFAATPDQIEEGVRRFAAFLLQNGG